MTAPTENSKALEKLASLKATALSAFGKASTSKLLYDEKVKFLEKTGS